MGDGVATNGVAPRWANLGGLCSVVSGFTEGFAKQGCRDRVSFRPPLLSSRFQRKDQCAIKISSPLLSGHLSLCFLSVRSCMLSLMHTSP